jgi:hypothetical protein
VRSLTEHTRKKNPFIMPYSSPNDYIVWRGWKTFSSPTSTTGKRVHSPGKEIFLQMKGRECLSLLKSMKA